MMKALRAICNTLLAIPIIWILFSYIEVILKNTQIHPQYSDFNIIVLLTKIL